MKTLENEFDEDMRNIYTTAKKEIGYNATRFVQLLSGKGGVATAKQLIYRNGGTYGFETLWENHRLDLSVENLVLQKKICFPFY